MLKLLQTDNLSVVWEIQTKNDIRYLFLVFTIQINWKLKTFSHYIELLENDYKELWPKNWEWWYILYNTLSELWYTEKDWWLWGNIITKWIDLCNNTDENFQV